MHTSKTVLIVLSLWPHLILMQLWLCALLLMLSQLGLTYTDINVQWYNIDWNIDWK